MIGCHFQNQNAHHSILQQLNLLKIIRTYIPKAQEGIDSSILEGIDSSILEDDSSNLATENLDKNLEQFELENKIDEMKLILKSLQNPQFTVKWFEVVDQIEDAFTGVKVLAFDENCIRLSLRIYIPTFESISYQLSVQEDITNAAKLNHELLIEISEHGLALHW